MMKKLYFILLLSAITANLYSQEITVYADSLAAPVQLFKKKGESTHKIILKCNGCDVKKEFAVSFEKQAGTFEVSDYMPKKIVFGEDFQKEHLIELKIKFQNDETTELLKMITAENDTTKIEHHLIFQKGSTQAETNFQKGTEEIKSDIASLKKQLLEGDESKSHIGRIVIKKEATVFKNSAYDTIKKELKNRGESVEDVKTKNQSFTRNPKAAIDSVTITISEGLIEYIKVRMKDGSFFINKYAPIPVITMERRFEDLLFNPDNDDFIILKDALYFDANKRFNYLPSDITIDIVNKENDKAPAFKDLYANAGLNSFVDLRIFSDLLGVFDNQANGLVQMEARSKIYLHRGNVFNRFAYTFYAVEPFFHLNKLDSKYDTIRVANGEINRMEVFRRNTFNAGLKFNAFRWDWRPSNSFFVNAGYMFSSSNIVMEDDTETKGTLHTPFFELGISSKRLENFGFDGSAEWLIQKLNDNPHFDRQDWEHLISFNVTMYFFQTGKKDKFFVRFRNYLNLSERSQDFYQLQFGYSKNLNF